MLYRITSKNGFETLSIDETEAKSMADYYHKRWWDIGIDMPVEVYREGALIYTAQGNPATP